MTFYQQLYGNPVFFFLKHRSLHFAEQTVKQRQFLLIKNTILFLFFDKIITLYNVFFFFDCKLFQLVESITPIFEGFPPFTAIKLSKLIHSFHKTTTTLSACIICSFTHPHCLSLIVPHSVSSIKTRYENKYTESLNSRASFCRSESQFSTLTFEE